MGVSREAEDVHPNHLWILLVSNFIVREDLTEVHIPDGENVMLYYQCFNHHWIKYFNFGFAFLHHFLVLLALATTVRILLSVKQSSRVRLCTAIINNQSSVIIRWNHGCRLFTDELRSEGKYMQYCKLYTVCSLWSEICMQNTWR